MGGGGGDRHMIIVLNDCFACLIAYQRNLNSVMEHILVSFCWDVNACDITLPSKEAYVKT